MGSVVIRDGIVVLNDNYEIELRRIPTELALVEWIVQLSSKRWFDAQLLRQFVHVVCEAKGWSVNGNIPF
jgi:hypothetical protein